jgi:hypothetical protein
MLLPSLLLWNKFFVIVCFIKARWLWFAGFFVFIIYTFSFFSPISLIYDFKPTHCAGCVCLISHHLKNKKPMERSPWAFISPQPPPLLLNDFKPTHCAGWVCLISHHLKNKKPMERSPFRVNPWQCLCVFLAYFRGYADASSWSYFRVFPCSSVAMLMCLLGLFLWLCWCVFLVLFPC